MGKQKTRYRVRVIYDQLYDVSNQVYCDLPLNVPIMFVKSRKRGVGSRLGFKRLTKRNDLLVNRPALDTLRPSDAPNQRPNHITIRRDNGS